MKKALVVFQSKTGITEKFAGEINRYIQSKGIEVELIRVKDYKDGLAEKADYLLLGCWTAGFMLLFQHPDAEWKQFAGKLNALKDKNAALFTTYKIATGSMFKSMRKYLGPNMDASVELKSKKGFLSDDHKKVLDSYLGSAS
jgi:flavodoxin